MRATSSRWPASRKSAPATRCAIRSKPVILEKMEFPDPVIEIAIEPKSKADQEKLGVALAKLAAEDPSFRVSTDPGVRPDHPQGDGRAASRHQGRHPEAHLQGRGQYRRAAGRLSREDHASRSTVDYTHKKQTGGSGQFAQVKIVVEPAAPGTAFEFENKVVGGAVPKEYIPGVEKGLESVLGSGVLAGFPVVDLKVDADRRRATTTSIRRRWPSKSRRARRCAKRCRRAARCCSSRS